jgi:5-methylcytosine-specific restriction endonuclease McrA
MQVLSRPPSGMPALVLNADYRPLSYYPLSLWPWQEVIKAVFLERVDVVSTYDHVVHSPSFEMKLPSVVSLKQYVPQERPPAFTRFNLFLRDGFSCQYCGSPDDLTFDHVIPRSRGGRTTWENIVTACAPCNLQQGRPHAARGGHASLPHARRPSRCTSCRTADAGSRRVTCTPAGWTICTGISSWKPEVGDAESRKCRGNNARAQLASTRHAERTQGRGAVIGRVRCLPVLRCFPVRRFTSTGGRCASNADLRWLMAALTVANVALWTVVFGL